MKHNLISWVCNAMGIFLTAIQSEEIFRIISLVLTILATLTSVAFTIWNWWKKATADGKITPEEVEDLSKDLEEEKDKWDSKNSKTN